MIIHYSTSYSNLLELRVNDTNSLEVKTVAGYINYKVCRLLFVLNQPRDAISQFRSFIENFRSRSGPPELIFQHHAWLAKQYCLFGELFEEAIRGGLPAVQTMHPGYYYELAARHAADRKAASLVLCQVGTGTRTLVVGNPPRFSQGVERYPANDPLAGLDSLEFYGQRPWRAGNLSAQPPDPIREMEGFVALQYNERHHINHSAIIISLLGNAITQYKNYRCPRMRRHLAIQMADEYYSSKDYGKALTLLTHMLWDYRAERWDSLISSLLTKALSCAYLTASVREYIDLSLEASAYFPTERREILFDNLLSVIQEKEGPVGDDASGSNHVRPVFVCRQVPGLGYATRLGFSVNKQCIVENLKEESLVALRKVCDGISAAGGLEAMEITNELVHAAKNSHAHYSEHLAKQREEMKDKINSEKERKQAAIEKKNWKHKNSRFCPTPGKGQLS
ncbi:Trafficking protein particle complex subunit 11 [Homalodisca vitripennis]|nr:Trafficking protein particle complex subunit 11 [Homalodisca vitripennis]